MIFRIEKQETLSIKDSTLSSTNAHFMKLGGCVYITTNRHHTVLYTGVTSDLKARVYKHKTKKYANSFTANYNADKVVYYKFYSTIQEAIAAEKQIKKRSRAYKEKLVNETNTEWKDLWQEIEKW